MTSVRRFKIYSRQAIQWAAGVHARPVTAQLAWVVFPFAAQQLIRLVTQIVLARLLAPEIFGLMLLVNTLRTGAELLSDIGIGQSVVRSRHGDDHRFLNVAWTLQIIRGACLSLAMMACAWPIAQIYAKPNLTDLLLALSPVFLITGLLSPSLFVMQRRLKVRARATYDLMSLAFQCFFTVALAAVMPNVWALVIGLLGSTIFATALSHLFSDGNSPHLAWSREYASEILNFGKWIFVSTAIYFAATNVDRMYLVGVLPLALAGIFGVARTFADMLGALAQRAGSYLVFPKVASLENFTESAPRMRHLRRNTLALVAATTAFGMAISDKFILIAYDDRYHAAAFMIPILLFGIWFSILSSFADAILMGAGRPAPGAWANGAKFAVLAGLLPITMAQAGLLEALFVLVLAEVARWLALAIPSRTEGFARLRDDVALTVLMLGLAIGFKIALGAAGLVPSLYDWWSMNALLQA